MNSIFIVEATLLRRRFGFLQQEREDRKNLHLIFTTCYDAEAHRYYTMLMRDDSGIVYRFLLSVDLSRMHTHDFHFAIRMAKEKNETKSKWFSYRAGNSHMENSLAFSSLHSHSCRPDHRTILNQQQHAILLLLHTRNIYICESNGQ